MSFGRSKKAITPAYLIHKEKLEVVGHTKYLGVTFSDNLKFNKHIDNVIGKANRMLGLIRRSLRHCGPRCRELAYFSLVRSQLEFACSLWDPATVGEISKLEMVQRKSVRAVENVFV